MHYVYILECCDKTLYTGWTTNLLARVKCHNSAKGAKYTKCRTPVALVYYETFQDKSSALKREIEIKKLPRDKKIALIATNKLQQVNV
ncbi:MAG: GIY-YIG nuclease family protein [Oscillospiraceae bacterium]